MTLAYGERLACVLLAAFFLTHLALGLVVWAVTPRVLNAVRGAGASAAARVLLALRLAPAAGSLAVVVGLCLPSYLRLEPEPGPERVGWICLAAALLGAGQWAWAAAGMLRAGVRSARHYRAWARAAHPAATGTERHPVLVVEGAAGVLALAGIWRTRIFVSRQVRDVLSPEQMDAALGHEAAHRESRDNLKRLLLVAAAGLAPLGGRFGELEQAWAQYAEWAADDSAAGGDCGRALVLASALVRVARVEMTAPLVSTLDGGTPLAMRVERLLAPQRVAGGGHWLEAAAGSAVAAVALAAPAMMGAVHQCMEWLVG